MASPRRVPVPAARPAPEPRVGQPAEPPAAPKPAPRRRIEKGAPLRVLMTGASGYIGTELQAQLLTAGHTVVKLVRRAPRAEHEFTWAPDSKILDFRLLEDVDVVVNLSGASLSRVPWTRGYRTEILRSRVRATEALVEAMAMCSSPPPVFLSGSAVGIYGDRPGTALTEESSRGEGFLAGVVEAWERAAAQAPARTRTVLLRTSPIYSAGSAPLKPMRAATSLGLGARIGTGGQHWAWISLRDEVAAIIHLLTSDLSGPVNLAGPTPATADDLTRRMAEDLHRPRAFAVPEWALDRLVGDFGREMLLVSQK